MSAYLVDQDHIRYLVQAATAIRLRFYWGDVSHQATAEKETELGAMLLEENLASLAYRYPSENTAEEWGAEPFTAGKAIFWHEFKPGQVFAALSCYEYQSCEHPEWEASKAHAFCHYLRLAYCHKQHELDGGTWGAPPRQVVAYSLLGMLEVKP